MSDFSPTIPIAFQIRKIIFEKFNDINVNFTNDDVFEILKQNGDVDPSWTIDDAEPFFHEICDSGLVRNIGQNFTTMYLKLFDLIEKARCDVCGQDVYLGSSEDRVCINPSCNPSI